MDIFSTEEQDRIVQAISVAESLTSGEIRLVIDKKVKGDSPITAAISYFQKLDMHKTMLKNGVLIYLAIDDHQFAIIGDKGINEKVETDFWESTKEEMRSYFQREDICAGLVAGIQHIGQRLQAYFPRRSDDVNELPDDIYYGSNG
ncbi:TPM domain-containing protein [Sphingobacterium sp. LRF_L2]|uniref:TPM domain-containing protein n=1 Tax=Sphingobacterium sp. LRF_L2 TaxID=3369421 RepID=UPI003F612EA2